MQFEELLSTEGHKCSLNLSEKDRRELARQDPGVKCLDGEGRERFCRRRNEIVAKENDRFALAVNRRMGNVLGALARTEATS